MCIYVPIQPNMCASKPLQYGFPVVEDKSEILQIAIAYFGLWSTLPLPFLEDWSQLQIPLRHWDQVLDKKEQGQQRLCDIERCKLVTDGKPASPVSSPLIIW